MQRCRVQQSERGWLHAMNSQPTTVAIASLLSWAKASWSATAALPSSAVIIPRTYAVYDSNGVLS